MVLFGIRIRVRGYLYIGFTALLLDIVANLTRWGMHDWLVGGVLGVLGGVMLFVVGDAGRALQDAGPRALSSHAVLALVTGHAPRQRSEQTLGPHTPLQKRRPQTAPLVAVDVSQRPAAQSVVTKQGLPSGSRGPHAAVEVPCERSCRWRSRCPTSTRRHPAGGSADAGNETDGDVHSALPPQGAPSVFRAYIPAESRRSRAAGRTSPASTGAAERRCRSSGHSSSSRR